MNELRCCCSTAKAFFTCAKIYTLLTAQTTHQATQHMHNITSEPDKSIAVLPFVNRSSEKNAEYFSDGIAEEIINALSKIPDLKVTSRTSAFAFKGQKKPVSEIGSQLGVAIILEGSVRLSGNTARITAQLINVCEDVHFWSETFDRSLENIFAVQDEISLLIADKLREHVGHFDLNDRLVDEADISIHTYKKYLKGRFEIMKLNVPGTEKGIAILQEVVAEAPHFPYAYLDLNQAYAFLGTMGLFPAREAFMKARPYLEKAIALGDHLAETQLNLAWIECWEKWNLKSAYHHLSKAIEIKPTDPAYLTISNTLAIEGKFDAAHNYVDKAIRLDPFSAMNHHFKGFIYYLEETYDKAIRNCEKSLTFQSGIPFPYLTIGLSYLQKGEYKKGVDYFRSLDNQLFRDLTQLGGLTLAFIRMGDQANTNRCMAELHQHLEEENMGSALFFLILAHAQLKNDDRAIALLKKGVKMRLPNMLLLFTEPFMKPLRSHPEYGALKLRLFGPSENMPVRNTKYKKALFDAASLEQNKARLEQLIAQKKPYLDAHLTLRELAGMMDLPANHLSQLLNEGFHQNFAAYMNTHRVNEFKRLVKNPKLQHLTILALAYHSGFNSKTVFNTFFKKATGSTPKAYWSSVRRK